MIENMATLRNFRICRKNVRKPYALLCNNNNNNKIYFNPILYYLCAGITATMSITETARNIIRMHKYKQYTKLLMKELINNRTYE